MNSFLIFVLLLCFVFKEGLIVINEMVSSVQWCCNHCQKQSASDQFCSIRLNVSREYSLKDPRMNPATSVISYIINKHR